LSRSPALLRPWTATSAGTHPTGLRDRRRHRRGTRADPVAYIRSQYEIGITDEFLPPVSICAEGEQPVRIADRDAVIFFNFRPDRARQLTHALLDRTSRSSSGARPHGLTYVTMTSTRAAAGADRPTRPRRFRKTASAEVVSKRRAPVPRRRDREVRPRDLLHQWRQERPFEGEDRS